MTELTAVIKHNILDIKVNKRYNHLVFGGTGKTAGFYSQLGVVIELMNQGYLKNVKTITSAGPSCILAMLLALGYTIDEIRYFYNNQNFDELYNEKQELTSDICHFAVNLSRNNGQALSNVIASLIEKRTGNKNYTLGELFSDREFTLNLVIVDLTKGSYVILNPNAHSNVPIRLAVRIACGYVPQIAPVIYDDHYFTGAYDIINIHHQLFPEHDPCVLTIDVTENHTCLDHNILSPFDLLDVFNDLHIQPEVKCAICNLQRIVIKNDRTTFDISKSQKERLITKAAIEVYDWQ